MIKTIFILFLSIFIFSGCISLTKEIPAYKTYSLTHKKENTKIGLINKTIKISEPKALNSINSRSISYSKDSFISDKYVLSRWSDKPTKMLQQNIASYLTETKSYKFITTSNIKISTDYKLISELTNFNHTFTNNNSYADFSMRIYLVNDETKKIYFRSFTYNKKASTNDAQGLVDAINYISNNFLVDLNSFIKKSIVLDTNNR